jgi:hypothetical protein
MLTSKRVDHKSLTLTSKTNVTSYLDDDGENAKAATTTAATAAPAAVATAAESFAASTAAGAFGVLL